MIAKDDQGYKSKGSEHRTNQEPDSRVAVSTQCYCPRDKRHNKPRDTNTDFESHFSLHLSQRRRIGVASGLQSAPQNMREIMHSGQHPLFLTFKFTVDLESIASVFSDYRQSCDQDLPSSPKRDRPKLMGKLRMSSSRLKPSKGRLQPAEHLSRTQRRYRSNPWRAWYSKKEWQDLRIRVANRDHWTCQRTGVLLIGDTNAPNSLIIHHKIPHRGDPELFWDEKNCEAVSKEWHDTEGQREDNQHG